MPPLNQGLRGLQLLFESSDEAPDVPGLGSLPGRVSSLRAQTIPHMGWNKVDVLTDSGWLGHPKSAYYYFAHSFAAVPGSAVDVPAVVEVDGVRLPAAVSNGAIRAVQFHPEKSGEVGLALLERMVSC